MSFEHLSTIYRNYDIRGHYPDEINAEEVKKIGAAIARKYNAKKVAIGRDNRPSADVLFEALAYGLLSEECEVVDLGLITTPMSYFVCGSTDVDATIMITASHMPSDYNGLKISIKDAQPVISEELQHLRELVVEHQFIDRVPNASITKQPPHEAWQNHFLERHDFSDFPVGVVIDPANMIGVLEIETLRAFAPYLTVHSIYDTLDHTCPNHEANPIKPETMRDLGTHVVMKQAALGIALDGDADRVGIVDENGTVVPSDIVGALISRVLLKKNPGSTIVYDIRSSKAVPETIQSEGGTPLEWKVGHTNIRTKMRETNAIFGIELAGHFFFRDTYFSEGGLLPVFLLLELLRDTRKPLSLLAAEVNRYHHSGEINSEVTRPVPHIYEELKIAFKDAAVQELDGLKLVCNDWWCSVRPSANDPVLRLNLEADTPETLQEKLEEALRIIRKD